MTEITRKLKSFTAEPKPAVARDPWADFRDVEMIDLRMEFQIQHSLGKLSRFFLELENRRLMATECPRCGAVWLPPRVICPEDQAVAEWREMPTVGRLAAAVSSAYTRGGASDEPLVLGYVEIDGATSLLLHQIRNFGDVARLTAGAPMKVAWAEQPVAHPMELFWFEPAD